jgi:nicotinamidase-related amidase
MDYLVIIDVQNDFVTGALGTKEAVEMLPRFLKKAKSFKGEIVFTMDTHEKNYLDTKEGRLLPVPHCIRGSEGWELVPELKALAGERHSKIFEKPTFGSVDLAGYLKGEYDAGRLSSVILVGLCTDICVVSNALLLKAYMPELTIAVDPSCCAGVTKERHEAALVTMRSCQIQVL